MIFKKPLLKFIFIFGLVGMNAACSIDSSMSQRILESLNLSKKPEINSVTHLSFYNSLTSSPNINWSSDSDSVVTEYYFALGTSSGSTDMISWTSAGMSTNLNLNSLSLVEGQTYYVSVKADGETDDLVSDVMTSSGWLVDMTPPTAPGIPDDGTLQINLSETNTLTWTASTDSLSGISHYEIALGTTPGDQNTLSWTNVGNVTSRKMTGLTLASGTTYYASVRAVDRAGNISAVSSSDGWLAGPYCSNKSSWLTYNASGAGTDADPYLICNAAQLASIGVVPAALSSSYKLMGDIDLAPYYATPNPQFKIGACGAGGCAVWDTGSFLFTGRINGNGHTISNFSFVSPGTRGAGFISGTWSGAKIHNLVLSNLTVSGGEQTGGLIGSSQFTAAHQITVLGSITANGVGAGGIIGTSYHVVLGNSSFSGSVNSTHASAGGAIGIMEESSLFSSKSTGSVTSTDYRIGGLVGLTSGRAPSRIANSFSSSSVSGGSSVGGLVGELSGERSLILKAYSSGSVTGATSHVGGLVGRLTNLTQIKDSFTTAAVNGTSGSGSIGYLVGVNSSGVISNSYYFSGALCDSTGSGGACGTEGLSHGALATFFSHSSAPMNSWDQLSNSADGNDDAWAFDGTQLPKVWFETDPTFTPAFTAGTGSQTDPYLISTAVDFNKISQNPRYMNASFRLSNDIDFLSADFKQIGGSLAAFTGQFFGNSKSLSNIVNSRPNDDAVGVFGVLGSGGLVENLSIINVSIAGKSDVGGVVGIIDASTVNDVVATTGSVTATGDFAGGFFGRAAKSGPTRSGNNLSVSGQNYVGGVGGEIYAGGVRESYSKGSVSGIDRVGGVLGYQIAGSTSDSYATGNITSTGIEAGGLIGRSDHSGVYRSYSTANVTGQLAVGGAFGEAGNTTIESVFVTGEVSGTGGSTEVGFFAGKSTSNTVSEAYYWTGATCDSTGADGACNTLIASAVINADDFKLPANAPLNDWDFSDVWEAVISQFPKLRFE